MIHTYQKYDPRVFPSPTQPPADLVSPAFTRFVPANRAARLGEWVTRLTLSYLCEPSDYVRLDDPAQVRELVDAFVLPGITSSSTFASASTEGASQ